MSYAERARRKARRPVTFASIPVPQVPEGLAEVGRFGDMVGAWLGELGGQVGSVSYLTGDPAGTWGEMLIETPMGPVLELRMRIMAEGASVIGDCMGCGTHDTEISLTMRGDKPVYLCRECHR